MAEIIDQTGKVHNVPGQGKTDTALGFGIAGTALGVLTAIGGGLLAGLGNKNPNGNPCGMSNQDLYIERKQCADFLDMTRQYYEGKMETQAELTNRFFEAYDRDMKNYFDLYTSNRNGEDRLAKQISDLNAKVDVMAAIRPYQDALINAKIDNNALVADFNLAKRTCRMIEGQLIVPSTPEVSGFPSYYSSVYVTE